MDDLQLPPHSGSFVTLDQMSSAANHVAEHYGEDGYLIAVETSTLGFALFRVHHRDGSEFRLLLDRYGIVEDVAQDLPPSVALSQATEVLSR